MKVTCTKNCNPELDEHSEECIKSVLSKPETTLIAVQMHDRLGRRLILKLNNDQKCVVGTWYEYDPSVKSFDVEIDNVELYRRLTA